ncbi:MAG: hypothetical protein HQK89_05885 [Nitrospirae bacterium]|nr:hypothetical protein [Nitrospirota bacterium]
MYGKIKRAGEKLIKKTGIDFNKYRDPSLDENINKATCTLVTPLSLITSVAKPVLISIAVFNVIVMAYIAITGANPYGALLLFIPGNVGNLAIGLSIGIMTTIRRFLNGTTQMLNYSLDIGKQVVKDMEENKANASATASLAEIIQGISYVTIAPCIEKAMKKRLGIFSIPVLVLSEPGILHSTKYLSIATESFLKRTDYSDAESETEITPGTSGEARQRRLGTFVDALEESGQLLASTFACVIPKLLLPAKGILSVALCFEVVLFFIVFKYFLLK